MQDSRSGVGRRQAASGLWSLESWLRRWAQRAVGLLSEPQRKACLPAVFVLQQSLALLHRLHVALFYVSGSFYHLSKRAAGISYVSVFLINMLHMYCCFSIQKISQPGRFIVTLQGKETEMVNEFNFLGVVLDKHVKTISQTIKNHLNCFKLIRNHISVKAAQLYMDALIFSHHILLQCGAERPSTAVKPVPSLYNQALKPMDKKTTKWHHCYTLKHNLLSFDNFVKLVKLFFSMPAKSGTRCLLHSVYSI